MLQTDRQYFSTVMGAIGRTMLVFLVLFNIYGVCITVVQSVLLFLPIGKVAHNVIYQTLYAAGYMLVFMLPVVMLRRSLRNKKCAVQPMSLSPRLSPMLLPIVFAGISICFGAAQINAKIVDLFGYSDFMSDMTGETMAAMEPYEIVLNFIVISVVPAFCEEFLFRGAILANCRPFGRANAIIISSVLFALMHQNAGQLLYTFAAGIVLGLVYEYTGSIWSCTVLHLCNNLFSVIQMAVLEKFGETMYAASILILLEVIVYLVGVISLGILIHKYFSKKPSLHQGIFEKDLPVADAYAAHPVRGREAAALFFRPSIVIFLIAAVAQMGLLVFLSLLI